MSRLERLTEQLREASRREREERFGTSDIPEALEQISLDIGNCREAVFSVVNPGGLDRGEAGVLWLVEKQLRRSEEALDALIRMG